MPIALLCQFRTFIYNRNMKKASKTPKSSKPALKGVFKLKTEYQPAGDQPTAIASLVDGIKKGHDYQTLLGVTGSGKTFTAANVIQQIGKPTLVIAHNKTLAAQLAQEFREFFPENAVHYFVSYYDYYQPEAYIASSDTFIEKEAQINEEIERLRHASTQALLTRKDVIIVASVSCIYGLGSPEEYEKVNLRLTVGSKFDRFELTRRLIHMYYERNVGDLSPGTFRALGNTIEIMPVSERVIYRVNFDAIGVSNITVIDEITRRIIGTIGGAIPDDGETEESEQKSEEAKKQAAHKKHNDNPTESTASAYLGEALYIFPAKHFVTPEDERERAIKEIQAELEAQIKHFEKEGKVLEAERIRRRTKYDLAMIKEVGYCNGIENYSRIFAGGKPGQPGHTLLSYFPHKADGSADFLTIIDESHVTLSQLKGMYAGDASRKKNLIDYGFRLPSAADNRPLKFDEFQERIGQVIFTTATPGPYELEISKNVAEQVIRPTGLIDPQLIVRPVIEQTKSSKGFQVDEGVDAAAVSDISGSYPGQIFDFIAEAEGVIKKGFRAIATTLTKKMAEDLTEFLKEKKIKTRYVHSDVETLERIQILTEFRKGIFDVLVGVNLLREGLDLPEVSLIGILDADKEGFLRSETSLIQTIGRAARNVEGRVILYADRITGSMERAIKETYRRRAKQIAFNTEHGITPKSIAKKIHDITEAMQNEHQKTVSKLIALDEAAFLENPKKTIKDKEAQMEDAVRELDFETAALLRDEIKALAMRLEKSDKQIEKLKKEKNKGVRAKREWMG
jgi:excinuclease ABC subunit B